MFEWSKPGISVFLLDIPWSSCGWGGWHLTKKYGSRLRWYRGRFWLSDSSLMTHRNDVSWAQKWRECSRAIERYVQQFSIIASSPLTYFTCRSFRLHFSILNLLLMAWILHKWVKYNNKAPGNPRGFVKHEADTNCIPGFQSTTVSPRFSWIQCMAW